MNTGVLFSRQKVTSAVAESRTATEALVRLGITAQADNYRRLREACERYSLEVPGSQGRVSAFDDVARFREAAEGANSQREVLDRMGVAPSTRSYERMSERATRYGVSLPKKRAAGLTGKDSKEMLVQVRESIRALSPSELETKVASSGGLRGYLYSVGLSRSSANYQWLWRHMTSIGSALPDEKPTRGAQIPDEDFFVLGVKRNTDSMRKRIVEGDLIPHGACLECGVGEEWNGKFLRLQLDHIDGNNINNLLSNLRFLCPNCHSQTDTFCVPHSRREAQRPD